MSTPTKEQVEAAKAYVRHQETPMQYALLRGSDTAIPPARVAQILLAALEAAEADAARKELWCGKATLAEIADALPEVET